MEVDVASISGGEIPIEKLSRRPLVEGVKVTGVTNKQLKQLIVGETPKHPETESLNATIM